jgi:hypothetical protein
VAEWQILRDTINVSGVDERRLSQRSTPFRTFALKQMTFARTSGQHLAGTGYFETFGY